MYQIFLHVSSSYYKNKKQPIPTTKNNVAAKPKTTFQEDFENALSIEEARALSLKHVRSLCKK